MARRYGFLVALAPLLSLSAPPVPDTLSTTRVQITDTSAHEYRPTLGANVVIYTSQDILQGTSAKIYGWMLDGWGQPVGPRIEVSDANGFDTDDRLNDISGSTVLYTSTGLGVTRLVTYDLGTESRSVVISDAGSVFDARIHGNRVVFVQGDGNGTVVQYVETDNSAFTATLSGPGASHAAIGSDLIVWTENGSEIWAFNPATQEFGLVEQSGGSHPTTSGAWVVYEYDNGAGVQIVAKQLSLALNQGAIQVIDTVVVAPQAQGLVSPRNPDIDGDLIAYEAIAAGSSSYDIFLHRLSDGTTFQVTNDDADQELNSIFADKVAYGDYTSGGMADIWLSMLTFVADPCQGLGGDTDGDGTCEDIDNCPGIANDQTDSDGDGTGDACDLCPSDPDDDIDGDGVCGDVDNCVNTANVGQADSDGDGAGDACDVCPLDALNDIDGDGLCGDVDPCPFDSSNTCDGGSLPGDWVLYGVNSVDDGLSLIDPFSGQVTLIGPLDPVPQNLVTPVAMAVRPADRVIFVWNNSDFDIVTGDHILMGALLTVDPCSGLATRVNVDTPHQGQLGALAFASDGGLLGLDYSLYVLDPFTGVKTLIGGFGMSGLRIGAAALSPAGVLYGVELASGAQRLVTIDTATGAATLVGTLSQDMGIVGSIVFDPEGVLLASGGTSTEKFFYDIDPASGAVSSIRPVIGGALPQGMGYAPSCDSVNTPPTALLTCEQLTSIGTDVQVRFDGSESWDLEDPVTSLLVEWTVDGIPLTFGTVANQGTIEVGLGFGSHTVSLRVTDTAGLYNLVSKTVTLDPAQLAVLDVEKATVRFDRDPHEIRLNGEIGLPFGVAHTELAPEALVTLDASGVGILPGQPVLMTYLVKGGGLDKWSFRDPGAALGIMRMDIDWKGARYRFKEGGFPVELRSELISSSETVLRVKIVLEQVGGLATIDFDGQALVTVDGSTGAITTTLAYTVEEEDKPGKDFTVTLPFPLLATTVITIATATDGRDLLVGSDLRASVGRFDLRAKFDPWLLPAGASTTPRSVHLYLEVGSQGYAGEVHLTDGQLALKGQKWSVKK